MPKRSKFLVIEHLENVTGAMLEEYQAIISSYVQGKQGVYALYDREKLYYVGLATNLKSRLKAHLRDRHAGKWDNFSVYLARNDDHLKELETLVLRIASPKGNAVGGKFPGSTNLLARLRNDMKEHHRKIEKGIVFKGKFRPTHRIIQAVTKAKAMESTRGKPPALAPYISGWFEIRAEYRGNIYKAKVHKDGRINFNGQLYDNPSVAGRKITKKSALNGWNFWKYRNDAGEWVYLKELRKKAGAKASQRKVKNHSESGRTPTLASFVSKNFRIQAIFKGEKFTATVRRNGMIFFNGKTFTSPSTAGSEITGGQVQGPKFWKYKDGEGNWRPLSELIQAK